MSVVHTSLSWELHAYHTLEFYVVKYDKDGVIEVKDDAEVEFKNEIPAGRDIDDFRVGDEVMAMWMDGRRYAAVVMKVGGTYIHIHLRL